MRQNFRAKVFSRFWPGPGLLPSGNQFTMAPWKGSTLPDSGLASNPFLGIILEKRLFWAIFEIQKVVGSWIISPGKMKGQVCKRLFLS